MSESEPTWVLMVRDVTAAARVENEPRTVAAMILDADTGLIRGASVGRSAYAACADAAQAALSEEAASLPPNPPAHVVYHEGEFVEDALDALRDLLPDDASPVFLAAPPISEAEDIFDSLVGQLAGRRQPAYPPEAAAWVDLYAHAAAFCRAEPWQLWSDVDLLHIAVVVDGEAARYVGVVLGQEGVQLGLALYPGETLPTELHAWKPGEPVPIPEGSSVLWLDPPHEVPAEYVAKAARYGWPADLEVAPLPAGLSSDGLADLDRPDARLLTVALAGVVEHHRRATAQPPDADPETTGTVELCDAAVGEFRVISAVISS